MVYGNLPEPPASTLLGDGAAAPDAGATREAAPSPEAPEMSAAAAACATAAVAAVTASYKATAEGDVPCEEPTRLA